MYSSEGLRWIAPGVVEQITVDSMKLKVTLFLLLSALGFPFGSSGQTATLLQHYDAEDLDQVFVDLGIPGGIVPINYEVDLFKINYTTLHPNGTEVPVTGAFALPSEVACPLPMSSYQHGTIGAKTDAPSYLSTEANLGVLYAAVGYATCMPDYIGLGDSPGMHLYVHADSEAQTSKDLLQAVVSLQDSLNFSVDGQLFLWGYSQGGHATMALHRLLEQEPLEPFSVTGCAPMSGPYDISGVQSAVIIDDQPYPTPGYLPYVALSYQEVYGNLYSDLEELFLPEYAAVIPELFDGTHSMGEINAAFPSIPNQMLQPDALEDFESNPEHPIALALAQNDVYDWAPVAPTRLYYCEGDDQVNYMNSVVALEAMTANGAAQIDAVDGGMLDHGACAPLAMLAGFNWFIDLYEPAFDPQIVAAVTQIEASEDGFGSIVIPSEQIDPAWNWSWSNGSEELVLEGLEPGLYTFTISNGAGCEVAFDFLIVAPTVIGEHHADQFNVYPNPVSDQITITPATWKQAELMTLDGVLVGQFFNRGETIQVSHLPSGVYVLRIDQRFHRVAVQR